MGSSRKQSWMQKLGRRLAGGAALLRGPARPFVLVAAVVLAILGGALLIRHRWPEMLPKQALTASAIMVTPQPKWIHGDVKADVIRDAHLTQLDASDPELTSRMAAAFAAHTWVAEVRRVSKHAGPLVQVQLAYRRPVAMVEVVAGGRAGLLPVDGHGVLLPPEDFSPNQAPNYLRIVAAGSKPAGPVGTSWGDPRVLGAARIAAAWNEHDAADGDSGEATPGDSQGGIAAWKPIGLYRIQAEGPPPQPGRQAPVSYALVTRQGRHVRWGHAPGEETPGEASASQKIARLIAHVQQQGPLDGQPAGEIDLRDAQSLRVVSRTARQRP
jgi:hypothetical protein